MLKRYLPAFTIPFVAAATFSAWGLLPGTAFADPSPRPRQVKLTIEKQGNGNIRSTACPGGVCSQWTDVNDGTMVTLTADPDLGFIFDRWEGACTGTSPCSLTMNGNKAVRAIFISRPLVNRTLTIDIQGPGTGTITSTACSAGVCAASTVVPDGTRVRLTASPGAGFNKFWHWQGDCSGWLSNSFCELGMDSDKSVRAFFAKVDPTLTVTQVGNGILKWLPCPPNRGCASWRGSQSFPVKFGAEMTLMGFPDPGFDFAGFGGACTGTSNCSLTMNDNKALRVVFSPRANRILQIGQQGGGTVTSTACPASVCTASTNVNDGTEVTLTAIPAPNFIFGQWEGCSRTSQTSAECFVTMNGNKTVRAVFSPRVNNRILTIEKQGNGTITSTACPGGVCPQRINVNRGTTVTLTANPDAKFIFSGWEGACTGTSSCSVSMGDNNNKTVRAVFSPRVYGYLSIYIEGAGTITSPACPAIGCRQGFPPELGTTVTLTAIPGTGFIFDRWVGCNNSTSQSPALPPAVCQVTPVTTNREPTVRAFFRRTPASVP